jgi:hypothetical protein
MISTARRRITKFDPENPADAPATSSAQEMDENRLTGRSRSAV